MGVRRLVEFVRAARRVGAYELALSLSHDVGYFVTDSELHDHAWRGCPAGIHHLGIQSDGLVKGCLALPEALGIASVRERPLKDIWRDDALWGAHRHFESSQAGPGCRDCAQIGECRGGCLAYSLARTGQPHNHPDCLSRSATSSQASPVGHRSVKHLPLCDHTTRVGGHGPGSGHDEASRQGLEHREAYDRPLTSACIELTRRCNLRCVHCGSNAGAASREELELSEFIAIFRDLRRLGGERVVLLGGEPLLHPDWTEIAEMARLFQLSVAFVTNGTRVTAPRARRLAELSTHVGVSIDGAETAIHDGVRGQAGALRGAWRGIERLLEAGARVTVITTLWQMNLGQLPLLRDQLIGRGLVWQLQLATASGERFPREQLLRPEQALAVARFIAETRATVPHQALSVAGGHSIGYHAESVRDYGARGAWHGCPVGIASIGISADGHVKGCLSLGATESVGSVRERPLFELWRDPRSFSRRRTAQRESLAGGCRRCPHADTCLAGCPAIASSVTGSADDNPMCLLRAEAGALV